MKKLLVSGIVLGLIISAGCAREYPKKLKVHTFDTALIQYQITGAAEGEEALYIRGDQKALHRYVTINDQERRTLELDLGPEKYNANLIKMTAVRSENPDYAKLQQMSAEEQEKHILRRELGLKEGVELPEPTSKTTYAGKQCDLYNIPNIGSACIWEGVVLMKEVILLDTVNVKTAISVETDIQIPAERFDLPVGVIVTN